MMGVSCDANRATTKPTKEVDVSSRLLIVTNMGPKASAPFQGQFVRNQVDALAALHPSYFCMTWHNDSKLNRMLKYPVLWLQFVWQYVFSLRRFDILHVHYYYPTIWLALTYKWLRNPKVQIVVTFHGSDIYLYKPESRLYKFAATFVRHFIFTSERLKQRFFRQDVPSTILPAGIHPAFALVEPVALPEKHYDVLYVGTMDHNKGMDRLLALLAQLPDARVALVGEGPWREKVQHALVGRSNVTMHTAQSPVQLAELYRQSRVFLSLSRNESFGLVMTEAMACGTPVIATVTDGANAQVRDGDNGYKVAQDIEERVVPELLGKIHQLFSLTPAQYQQMQLTCQTSAKPYLVSTVATALTDLYQSLSVQSEQ